MYFTSLRHHIFQINTQGGDKVIKVIEDIELRNKAESMINDIDLAMQEKGESMDPNQKEQTQKLRDELKTALDNNDMETLRNRINELEQAAAYMQQQQANAGAQPNEQPNSENTAGTNPDDVVDADFTKKN